MFKAYHPLLIIIFLFYLPERNSFLKLQVIRREPHEGVEDIQNFVWKETGVQLKKHSATQFDEFFIGTNLALRQPNPFHNSSDSLPLFEGRGLRVLVVSSAAVVQVCLDHQGYDGSQEAGEKIC